MKVLVHSNAPWARTGYGQQTDLLTRKLKAAGHQVGISCSWGIEGSAMDYDGMVVYPADGAYGNTWLVAAAASFSGGDLLNTLVLTLMDVWVLADRKLGSLNLACWVPVDHEPVSPNVAQFFEWSGACPIAMSRFGERMLQDAGLDPLYVPHAIDTDLFRPIPQAEARASEVGCAPADAFVVGMVANNAGNAYPRKSFPEVFKAFARLRARHDDAILYLHSRMQPGAAGLDLLALAQVMGIPKEALAWTPPFAMWAGVDQAVMPWLYSQFDVLANPSLGEGFGIPIVEAQACGVPVIVNDFSAMPELVGDGWKVSGTPLFDPSQGSYFQSPNVDEVYEALEAAYERRGGASEAARAHVLQYDWNTVWDEHWTPALDAVMERRRRLVEMPEVTLNRAARRRAEKRRQTA
jgi:hypothetical protein